MTIIRFEERRVIDMSIDEAIERCETLATNGQNIFPRDPDIAEDCNEKYKQLAEWLEDYKRIKMLIPIEQALKNEYNKAIDDFVKFANTMPTVEVDGEIRPMLLEEMAERLNVGGKE